MDVVKLTTPLTDSDLEKLAIGQRVLLSGKILTARDAAHKKLVDLLAEGKELPVDLQGQVVYYVGPTPAKPGEVIGSAGPTTSGRMDAYARKLMEKGLKGMIGKGSRNQDVVDAMHEHKCVYFAAIGGAAALIAKKIKASRVVAYEELGPEAIRELEVEDFPVVVVNDIYKRDLYKEGIKLYSKL